MKKEIYDYSGLRPSTIRQPQYRHLLLLLGWVAYLSMFVITEKFVSEARCHVVHSVVDDKIPFVEYFVIFYVFWYLLVGGSLLYFMLFDVESFKHLQIFLIVTQVVAVIIYIFWPSVQYLRPAEFPRENVCTRILSIIYSFDTPTGVCPSMHVAFSLAVLSTWLKKQDTKLWVKILITIDVVLICFAVMFVKQHSFVDVVAAIPVCILAEIVSFGSSYWAPKLKKERGN